MTSHTNLELVVATYNQGKLREVQAALDSLPLKFRYLGEFADVSPVSELGETYQANAVQKAIGYAKQTRLFALADDSGLEVDALGGAPGVFSARFGGDNATDDDRIRILLSRLWEQPSAERNARFVCCMALAGWPSIDATERRDEPQVLTIVEATCEGAIALEPKGINGFGFDPVFIPTGYEQTFAQLPTQVKARISHRAKAMAGIRNFITQWIAST